MPSQLRLPSSALLPCCYSLSQRHSAVRRCCAAASQATGGCQLAALCAATHADSRMCCIRAVCWLRIGLCHLAASWQALAPAMPAFQACSALLQAAAHAPCRAGQAAARSKRRAVFLMVSMCCCHCSIVVLLLLAILLLGQSITLI